LNTYIRSFHELAVRTKSAQDRDIRETKSLDYVTIGCRQHIYLR
jgi:hypothetical protein